MSKTGVYLFLFFMVITGCKPEAKKIEYKLNDDQLARLLFDIQLAEVSMPDLGPTKQDSLKDIFWKNLTEIYKLTEPEIKSEIEKLESDPEKMKLILAQIKDLSEEIR